MDAQCSRNQEARVVCKVWQCDLMAETVMEGMAVWSGGSVIWWQCDLTAETVMEERRFQKFARIGDLWNDPRAAGKG